MAVVVAESEVTLLMAGSLADPLKKRPVNVEE